MVGQGGGTLHPSSHPLPLIQLELASCVCVCVCVCVLCCFCCLVVSQSITSSPPATCALPRPACPWGWPVAAVFLFMKEARHPTRQSLGLRRRKIQRSKTSNNQAFVRTYEEVDSDVKCLLYRFGILCLGGGGTHTHRHTHTTPHTILRE